MSRTYKDRPTRVRFPEYCIDDKYEDFEYELETPRLNWQGVAVIYGKFSLKRRGIATKKRKGLNTEWKWFQSTPSWWTRCIMNRPQRRASKLWEKDIVKQSFWDIAQDEFDPPLVGNKPHIYYY